MGLILKQTGQRTRLQKKIAAEMAGDKPPSGEAEVDSVRTDFVSDSVHQRDMEASKSMMGVWVFGLLVVAVVIFVAFIALV